MVIEQQVMEQQVMGEKPPDYDQSENLVRI